MAGRPRRGMVSRFFMRGNRAGIFPRDLMPALRVTPKNRRPKCGAKTRNGGSCQARAVWDLENDRPRNGRCRLHGGLSSGPRRRQVAGT